MNYQCINYNSQVSNTLINMFCKWTEFSDEFDQPLQKQNTAYFLCAVNPVWSCLKGLWYLDVCLDSAVYASPVSH